MRRLRFALALVLVPLAVSFLGANAAAAAPPASLAAAREVLSLTKERLDLMEEVMAAKWFSRAPIEDPAQEAVVIEAAVQKARGLNVAAFGTRSLFEGEILAAKEVQLGYGSRWLYVGAPADLAAPNLEVLREELSAISGRIIEVLPRLYSLRTLPKIEDRLESALTKIVTVPFLGEAGRVRIVAGLLAIRPVA